MPRFIPIRPTLVHKHTDHLTPHKACLQLKTELVKLK